MKVKIDRSEVQSSDSQLPFRNSESVQGISIYTNSSLDAESLSASANLLGPKKIFDNIFHHPLSGGFDKSKFKVQKNSCYFFVGWIPENIRKTCNNMDVIITPEKCSSSEINQKKLSTLMSGWGDVNSFSIPLPHKDLITFWVEREGSQNDGDEMIPGIKKSILGFYFPAVNVFIGRDYAHSEDGLAYLNICILPTLMEYARRIELETEKCKKDEYVEKYPASQFTFGADPEFLFWERRGKNFISAYEVLHDRFGECDLNSSRCQIGVDGHQSTGELRPAAAKSFMGLYSNLKDLLETINNKYQEYDVDLTGESEPIGFHFHFGHHYFKNNKNAQNFVKVLDYYFGKNLYDLNSTRRKNSGYERLGAYENKRYGFEYRTLPAMIYHDPDIFKIISKAMNKLAIKFLKGESLDINTRERANADDFLKLITRDEYEKLDNFVTAMSKPENRKKEQGRTLEYWCKEKRTMQSYAPTFSGDEFYDEIKSFIRQHKLKTLGEFHYYGIGNSKGSVIAHNFPIKISGYENIIESLENPKYHQKKMIGIPYCLRTSDDCSDLGKILNKIYNHLKKEGTK